jgi:N-acyl homoserine lactone hydrolase
MKKLLAILLFVFGAALALLASSFSSDPLPPPAPLAADLPHAAPPPAMALFQLPTGTTRRSAAFGYRGGSFRDPRDFAMTAVLVRHPRGDLLIDTGFGSQLERQIDQLPFFFRMTTKYERGQTAAEQLDAAGYDRKKLRAIVITHAHWDHVSGIPDFEGTPVLVSATEKAFIQDGGMTTAPARAMTGVRYEEYAFDGGAYLGFEASHDVYGDGSVVLAHAPGHTPGSVVVFLTLPDGKRYALVGDLVWQLEGITLREERPWLLRRLADQDEERVRENILRMAAIAAKFPDIVIVPAHDLRGFAGMPRL